MKIRRRQLLSLLTLGLFFIVSISSYSQTIEKKSGQFHIGEQKLTKEEVGDLLLTYTGSGYLYNRHIKLRHQAKVMGYTTIVIYGVGMAIIATADTECYDIICFVPPGQQIIGAMFLLGGS